ncbi:hypothetical protein BGZ63DRAFT_401806 [Mariannaea sp. PMI_226]|nr:hypothetical protein BGZ63DRAFT_401806 [Mariannaea sp. PMI_226]
MDQEGNQPDRYYGPTGTFEEILAELQDTARRSRGFSRQIEYLEESLIQPGRHDSVQNAAQKGIAATIEELRGSIRSLTERSAILEMQLRLQQALGARIEMLPYNIPENNLPPLQLTHQGLPYPQAVAGQLPLPSIPLELRLRPLQPARGEQVHTFIAFSGFACDPFASISANMIMRLTAEQETSAKETETSTVGSPSEQKVDSESPPQQPMTKKRNYTRKKKPNGVADNEVENQRAQVQETDKQGPKRRRRKLDGPP